jgi:hypothetical protein
LPCLASEMLHFHCDMQLLVSLACLVTINLKLPLYTVCKNEWICIGQVFLLQYCLVIVLLAVLNFCLIGYIAFLTPLACCMPNTSYSPWFDPPNIWWRVQIIVWIISLINFV